MDTGSFENGTKDGPGPNRHGPGRTGNKAVWIRVGPGTHQVVQYAGSACAGRIGEGTGGVQEQQGGHGTGLSGTRDNGGNRSNPVRPGTIILFADASIDVNFVEENT
jgi:hypothetical protein